jgi:NAD(P) transhydrogenase subunit alpha
MDYNLIKKAQNIADQASQLAIELNVPVQSQQLVGVDYFSFLLSVFMLSCVIGYYVVWKVTPALHTPLMAITNAISSIIIIGAIIASSAQDFGISSIFGFIASMLAAINIFGGFIITQRMLAMFKKKTSDRR